jgi:hypothetical protein
MPFRTNAAIILGLFAASLLFCHCGTGAGPASSGRPQATIDTLFTDGFEEGMDLWTSSFAWVLSSDAVSGDYSMQAWDNSSIAGSAEITLYFDITDYDTATLTFWSKTNYFYMNPGAAEASILVEINDSVTETVWAQFFLLSQPWTQVNVSLDEYCGSAGKLEIAFWYYKTQPGTIQWWVDDVMLMAETE